MDVSVHDVERRSRYELVVDDQVVAIVDYRLDGDRVVISHTEVLPHLRGQGLGERLVEGVLDDIRRRGRTVVPLCWFVAGFIETNEGYDDLVA